LDLRLALVFHSHFHQQHGELVQKILRNLQVSNHPKVKKSQRIERFKASGSEDEQNKMTQSGCGIHFFPKQHQF